jgi:putative transposase
VLYWVTIRSIPPMPQSFASVNVHIIFATKGRAPLLKRAYRVQVHAYMAQLARGLRSECLRVGGVDDHVHLLVRLARTVSIAKLVEHVKVYSSHWIKEQHPSLEAFRWQNGYACFAVSQEHLPVMLDYIDRQEEHHLKSTFQDEYLQLLTDHGIKWDERYVWD